MEIYNTFKIAHDYVVMIITEECKKLNIPDSQVCIMNSGDRTSITVCGTKILEVALYPPSHLIDDYDDYPRTLEISVFLRGKTHEVNLIEGLDPLLPEIRNRLEQLKQIGIGSCPRFVLPHY